MQITAGRGPAECCWVVAQLVKVVLRICEVQKLEATITDRQKGPENGTLSSAIITISGKGAHRMVLPWKGVIQWVGKSPYRKFHKRKNWFVGVDFLDISTSQQLNMTDLTFDTFRASGPGGQHRNKVESAVRVVHKPTGLMATSSESRSQHQNKQLAIRKLEKVFREELLQNQKKQLEEQWQQHLSLERGNAVRVFKEHKFEQVK